MAKIGKEKEGAGEGEGRERERQTETLMPLFESTDPRSCSFLQQLFVLLSTDENLFLKTVPKHKMKQILILMKPVH